jgi:hypothetical protein
MMNGDLIENLVLHNMLCLLMETLDIKGELLYGAYKRSFKNTKETKVKYSVLPIMDLSIFFKCLFL